ncbi:MAG: flagellar biosynthetic protein FliO [Lachnospiraceae bacterium]|nr:flagellar biosynthetic protein FliO [Lachnospiraceae bacterium]
MERIAQFLTVLLIFAFVLFLTWITTRWAAGFAKKQVTNKNIELIETVRVAPSKFVAIVRVGERYLSIGVGKDEITFLAEISREELDLKSSDRAEEEGPGRTPDFKAMIDGAMKRLGKKGGEDHDGGEQ